MEIIIQTLVKADFQLKGAILILCWAIRFFQMPISPFSETDSVPAETEYIDCVIIMSSLVIFHHLSLL